MRKKIKVTVIDSGVCMDHEISNVDVSGYGLQKGKNGKLCRVDDFEDKIGHGTAVIDELLKENVSIGNICCIKIYEDSLETTNVESLMEALRFVEQDTESDIVLISSGVTFIDKYYEMKNLVDKIIEQGKIIVSALDNNGAMSFPAAFEGVIGVAEVQDSAEQLSVRQRGPINVMLPHQFYRLKWVKPSKIIISGSSFAAAKVASCCANILFENENSITKSEIMRLIANKFGLQYDNCDDFQSSWERGRNFVKGIKKAVVFPWNKEIHALARFQDLLPFEIVGFYDTKYGFNIGKEIKELLGVQDELGKIKNYDKIDWEEDFDTVICGHCIEISNITHVDFLQDISEQCRKYQKKLYAFDREFENIIGDKNKELIERYIPGIKKNDVGFMKDTRLYDRLTPVVGVFGTSSQQGKYTLQLELRRYFSQQGYIVGQISTEPSGYLFGCDAVFPFGYNENVFTEPECSVKILNRALWEASDYNKKDVVLVGGQSGVVPYSHHNLNQFNFKAYEFLCGVNPDVFVLCVNPHDSIDYIRRSLQYLTSFNGMPVVALVLFPIIYEPSSKLGYGYKKRHITEKERQDISVLIQQEVKIPVYYLEDKFAIERIFNHIIEELCE